MKKTNSIVSVIALLLANFVYIIWLPYPKSILGKITPDSFPSDLITNLLFFVLYAVLLVFCVNSVLHPGEELTKKQIFISVPVIIGIQLCFDIVNIIFENLLKEYSYLTADILTVAELLVFILACIIIVNGTTLRLKRFLVIFTAVSLVALTVFVIIDVGSIKEYHAFLDKYQITMTDLIEEEKKSTVSAFTVNREFLFQVRNALLSSITCVAAIIALYFSTIPENSGAVTRNRKGAYLSSRIMASIILMSAICVIKMLLLPYDFFRITRVVGESSSSMNMTLYYSAYTTIHYRATGYSTRREVYHKTKYEISYDGDTLLSFNIDGEIDGSDFEYFDINGVEVRVAAKTMAIFYVQNGEPVCVKVSDTAKAEYDKTLLSACELLLEKGRVSCFESVGEYINRHDPEFLKPYVERYRNGEFTADELSQMNGIKPEFITQTSLNFVEAKS